MTINCIQASFFHAASIAKDEWQRKHANVHSMRLSMQIFRDKKKAGELQSRALRVPYVLELILCPLPPIRDSLHDVR